MTSAVQLRRAVWTLRRGGVVAYPTEAVWGLGCDPENDAALRRLLHMKSRPWHKGLILVAADTQQLSPYITRLPDPLWARVSATWPGPATWVMPCAPGVSRYVTGRHDSIAVRVSAHPLVQALCRSFGHPLISTSANVAGLKPARTILQVRSAMNLPPDYVLPGQTGGASSPSVIRDALTGEVLRAG